MNKRFISKLLIVLLNFFILKTSDGTLDPSFGGQGADLPGTVTTAVGPADSSMNDLAIQTDQKIVGVGFSIDITLTEFSTAIARYNSDGSLDSTFGAGGIRIFQYSTQGFSSFDSVLVQPDNKIIASGLSVNAGSANLLIVRHNADGTLDTSFNGTGFVINSTIGDLQNAKCALQSDGKIIIAGTLVGVSQIFVARFNANGTIDTTFNGTGTNFLLVDTASTANDVKIQADGKIVVAGSSRDALGNNSFLVARFNADGSLDTTFNSPNGFTTTRFTSVSSDEAFALDIQQDGKIVLAGRSIDTITFSINFAAARYNLNGSLDTTFNSSGTLPGTEIIVFPIGNSSARNVIIQQDNKIIISGLAGSGPFLFGLAKLNSNGTLDTTFNPGGSLPGTVTTQFNSSTADSSTTSGLQADGKIVLGGSSSQTTNEFALARYFNSILPLSITITSPANGSNISDTTPLITGTTSPGGLLVDVVVRNSSNVIVFSATTASDISGNWSVGPVSPALANGTYTITATLIDGTFATSTFTIEGTTFVTITFPRNNSTINTPTPLITGTAEADDTIQIFMDGVLIGTTTAIGGIWQFQVTNPLSNGRHILRVVATDAEGNTAQATSIFFVSRGIICISGVDALTKAIRNKYGS